MIFRKKYISLQILFNVLVLSTGQWCGKYEPVLRSRIVWNNGERMVSKRTFFGNAKYKYEPYVYSTVKYENSYEYKRDCCDGYRKISNICEPICSPTCPTNTKCVAPDECACNDGYSGLNADAYDIECSPTCNPPCMINANCTKPNTCACTEGYKISWGITDDRFGSCQPVCAKECPMNSYCHKPNECQCNVGYSQIESGLCNPICEPICPENSICLEPNKCSCLNGYEMSSNQCQPICTKACPARALCKEPNKCECEPGYQLKLTSIHDLYCEPVCQSNCSTFGKCVAPNKCECLEGYAMDEMEICQPVCRKGCLNGLCFKPNVCICNSGYLMGPHAQCVPTCSLHCFNGSCVEPEICQCHQGFRLKKQSINVCEPICEPECKNGICAGPNVCVCHENYEPMTTELGLNHNDCQITSTTAEFYTTTPDMTTWPVEVTESTPNDLEPDVTSSTPLIYSNESTTSETEFMEGSVSTPKTHDLAPAEICSDLCQCWQEYDEFGPLITEQCTHVCLDDHDKPCLNLTLCQCDMTKTHLICRSSYDSMELDDPLKFMCKIKRFQVTTSKSIDMKSVGESKDSIVPWLMIVCMAVFAAAAIVAGLIFYRSRRIGDPILEYEL